MTTGAAAGHPSAQHPGVSPPTRGRARLATRRTTAQQRPHAAPAQPTRPIHASAQSPPAPMPGTGNRRARTTPTAALPPHHFSVPFPTLQSKKNRRAKVTPPHSRRRYDSCFLLIFLMVFGLLICASPHQQKGSGTRRARIESGEKKKVNIPHVPKKREEGSVGQRSVATPHHATRHLMPSRAPPAGGTTVTATVPTCIVSRPSPTPARP